MRGQVALNVIIKLRFFNQHIKGTKWISGRVLDSKQKACEYGPHKHHCVVSLSKTH